jgi:hypothetical protein
MADDVRRAFLTHQHQTAMKLADDSDILDLLPLERPPDPPEAYIARYFCNSVVRRRDGQIVVAPTHCEVGIRFSKDHLRYVNPSRVVTWLGPSNFVHPNIRGPGICCGHIEPGTGLVDILYQCFEIICYVNWAPHDPLDPVAAQWARNNQHLFPVETRPLKRRNLELQVTRLTGKGRRS